MGSVHCTPPPELGRARVAWEPLIPEERAPGLGSEQLRRAALDTDTSGGRVSFPQAPDAPPCAVLGELRASGELSESCEVGGHVCLVAVAPDSASIPLPCSSPLTHPTQPALLGPEGSVRCHRKADHPVCCVTLVANILSRLSALATGGLRAFLY